MGRKPIRLKIEYDPTRARALRHGPNDWVDNDEAEQREIDVQYKFYDDDSNQLSDESPRPGSTPRAPTDMAIGDRKCRRLIKSFILQKRGRGSSINDIESCKKSS